MGPVRVTFRRTFGLARGLYTTALATAGFLSWSALAFAFGLEEAEGLRVELAPLWAVSLAPALPFLAAILGMDVWSDERRSGRIDVLLSSPVRERDLVFGKFLGVWAITLLNIVIALVSSLAFVRMFAPALLDDVGFVSFLPGVCALAVQGMLWCAVAVAASAWFMNSAAAATTTIALLSVIPRGAWYALVKWSGAGRSAFGDMPLDAQVFDFASGFVSTGALVSCFILAVAALLFASKAVAALRCVGRGGRGFLATTWFAVFLGAVATVLAVGLAYRLDIGLDLPLGKRAMRFSARTRDILAESRGTVTVTAFLERGDPRFRPLSHFLKALSAEADAMCGVRIGVRYVDPALDLGEAGRLDREGVRRDSLVFEHGGRIVGTLHLEDDCGERACMSVIERVSLPFRRSCVYWTKGHGEASFDDYGPFGLSNISRDLALDGYGNKTIDLTSGDAIADDCALVVVAGAKNEFSAAEMNRLRNYLEGRGGRSEGGRLLVLLDSAESGGLSTLLSEWGIRPMAASLPNARTLSGTDVVVRDFATNHVVSAPFVGQQMVLDDPVSFGESAAAESASAADRRQYSPLVGVDGTCLAAAVEWGEGGSKLALRPTRIVAVGDTGFVQNAPLRKYANANRDFFLNAVKYLSGRDVMTQSGVEPDLLVSGMDRDERTRFAICSGVAFPSAMFLLLSVLVMSRRRKA